MSLTHSLTISLSLFCIMTTQFQRMVVIPQNEYLQLTTLQDAKQPIAQQFFDAEQKYEDAASISDPYTRLMMRSENLDRMKALKDEMRNYLSLATPKPYRSRAERLFSVLEPYLKWNERGELIDVKTNRVIAQSQVSDLIQHAVRDRRRRNISPEGWPYFMNQLRERNVPQMLLNLPTLDEMKKGVTKGTTFGVPSKTPRKISRKRSLSLESYTPVKEVAPRRKLRPKRFAKDFLVDYKG